MDGHEQEKSGSFQLMAYGMPYLLTTDRHKLVATSQTGLVCEVLRALQVAAWKSSKHFD